MPPARVRLTLAGSARPVIGKLMWVTRDTLFIETSRVASTHTLQVARGQIERVEVSVGRRATARIIGAAVLGELVGLGYAFLGHPGLPHLGDDTWASIISEGVVYSAPLAFLSGYLAHRSKPEQWAPVSLAVAPGGEGLGPQLRVQIRF